MSLSKNQQEEIKECQQINWVVAVLCFNKTGDALDNLITRRLQKEIDSWPKELRNNLSQFSKQAYADKDKEMDKRYIRFTKKSNAWEIVYPAHQTHTQILEKILSKSANRKCQGMQWQSNSKESTGLYWILGKFYMPYGNSDSQRPGDTDPISKIDLLKNCKLFCDDFDVQLLEELESARHVLFHGNHRLTSKEKETFIGLMEQLLITPCLQDTTEVLETLGRLKYNSVQLIPSDLHQLVIYMEVYYPHSTREEILKMSQKGVNDCVNYALQNLKKTSEKLKEKIKEELKEKEFNETVGGGVGAAVLAGAGVATGAAAGAIGGSILVSAGLIASAPVAVPVAIVGTVGLGIGWIAGKAGGGVVSLFKKIT